MRLKLAAMILLAAAIPRSRAAMPTRADVDRFVAPAAQLNPCAGGVVGLIDSAGRQVVGYGVINCGGPVPDGKTIFEIGSVTKTFTATLLAQMVIAGEVRLDQPVVDLLPAGVEVPQKDGIAITLLHLATHASGLPRIPSSVDKAAAGMDDPYTDYTPAKLYDDLAHITLSHRPGDGYEYSNLGVGLLGHALALRAGKNYEQLLLERVCTPLGMNSTRLTLDESMKSRLAPGHIGTAVVHNWDFDVLAGAGAIRSTADNMLIYLAANIGLAESPLAAAMKMAQEKRATLDERNDIGLVWGIGKRTGARWHNGQTLGYHTFVAFVPEKRVGVVILSNSGGMLVDTIGTQLVQLMLGEKVEPLPTTVPATPSTRTTSWASPTR